MPADADIRIRVPATSANLGPAFDCAGLALTCHDLLDFAVVDSGLSIEVRGCGEGELPGDESHLVVRAFRAACKELDWSPPGLRLLTENCIPQGRGMGSSAAAVVAGIYAAWSLCPDVDTIDGNAVLRLATEFEGHSDNVAACLFGGAVLSLTTERGVVADGIEVAEAIRPVVLVPENRLATDLARSLLPASVPHADAAFNAGRAALLVHALREPGLLLDATEDRLHQRQRTAAMPESLALIGRLRAREHAAVVSGAGPSVLVLAWRPGEVEEIAAAVPGGWTVRRLEVDLHGVTVFRQPPGLRPAQVSSR